MSKKFKGKTCAYCGAVGSSTTADHVFAREFFLKERRRRDNLPKVPACLACNSKKAELEHYLTQVLPFGGRHVDASENLCGAVPKRLLKSPSLRSVLRRSLSPIWLPDPSGLILRTHTVAIDSDILERWCVMVVKGLSVHHWRTLLHDGCFFEFMVLTTNGEAIIEALLSKRGAQRVQNDLGAGTFRYEAVQGIDNPLVSAWRLTLYGGLMLGGADPGPFGPDRYINRSLPYPVGSRHAMAMAAGVVATVTS